MYFNVGYPLGYFKTSDAPEYRNKIQIDGKFAILDVFLTAAWSCLGEHKPEDLALQEIEELLDKVSYIPRKYPTAPEVLKALLEKGVVIHASSNEEVFSKIKHFKAFRYGIPLYDVEAMEKFKELKHVMLSGDDPIPVSDLQIEIWRKADGIKTFEQIFNDNFSDISVSDFVDNILFLSDEFLIIIF